MAEPAHPDGTLSDVARLRIRLTEQLGTAPTAHPMSGVRDHAAAFTNSGNPWTDALRHNETEWDRWLRLTLAAGEPLQLMTIEETRTNARATQAPMVPIADPDAYTAAERIADLEAEQDVRRYVPVMHRSF